MDLKIKPLWPYVLCSPFQEEKTSQVILPDTMEKEPDKGVVMTVAEGIEEVSVGEKVCWKPLAGTYIDNLILVDLHDLLYKF
jgi:co-chaperonin GroES (HSP10)